MHAADLDAGGTMKNRTSAAGVLLAIAAALPAQAQSPSGPALPTERPAFARVDMPGVSTHAGRVGYAHLVFRPEGTDVLVQVPPTNNVTRPMHLYTAVHEGTCGHLG